MVSCIGGVMSEGGRSEVTSSRVAKLALGLIGTLVLGAMGSGLWEIVFRPGLTRFGDFLISLSTSANSAVYTTAALDPTPVPGLVVLLLLVQIPALMAMWFIHLGFVKPLIERRLEADFERIRSEAADLPDSDDIVARNLRRRLRIAACVGAAVMLLFSSVTIYAYTIENKAVIIWRVFHQNLDICRPISLRMRQFGSWLAFDPCIMSEIFRRLGMI